MTSKAIVSRLCLAAASALLASTAFAQDGERADKGFFLEQGRAPAFYYEEHNKVEAALKALKPQKKGAMDVFVVVAGIDADGVFGKEASETAKVLARRFGAENRTVLLAAGNGADVSTPSKDKKKKGVPEIAKPATGNISNLMAVLAGVAARMNLNEDVLVLYTTSHGGPDIGIMSKDETYAIGLISPKRMAEILNGLGFQKRVVMISACYSGAFVPTLQNDDSIIITAASAYRSSFGCHPGNDWTFFGDALINGAMRDPKPLDQTVQSAFTTINGWETKYSLTPSEPQIFMGEKAKVWIKALEAKMPRGVTQRVGKPATDTIGK